MKTLIAGTKLSYVTVLCIVSICLCLNGCLLNLRQKASIPYKVIAVTGNPSSDLRQKLYVDILTFIDIKVAIDPKDADLIFEIVSDVPNSQMDAYNAFGQITAYALNEVVVFRAYDRNGNEVIPEAQIFAVRDINFSVSTPLSSDIQQQQMMQDMRKELAMQMTLRIMSLGYVRKGSK